MKRSTWFAMALSVLVSLVPVTCQAPYSNPPATFQDSDLVGTWETRYGGAVDRLIIRADGTFKQIYREGTYVYETPWNRWWTERLPNGRVRVHLEGARFYIIEGIESAEQEGMYPPYPPAGLRRRPRAFKDPFGGELLEMVGELTLNVRRLSSGELILHHMWIPGDGAAFAIIGGEREMFRRVDSP